MRLQELLFKSTSDLQQNEGQDVQKAAYFNT